MPRMITLTEGKQPVLVAADSIAIIRPHLWPMNNPDPVVRGATVMMASGLMITVTETADEVRALVEQRDRPAPSPADRPQVGGRGTA